MEKPETVPIHLIHRKEMESNRKPVFSIVCDNRMEFLRPISCPTRKKGHAATRDAFKFLDFSRHAG